MITKEDSSNSIAYRTLFEKYNDAIKQLVADKKLESGDENKYTDDVGELGEYFGNFDVISKYFLQQSGAYSSYYNPSFIRLPLDESYFSINANTRVITVPDEFKNGISVEGDIGCEILFFKIDRYFDGIDFNEKNICIQCENASRDQRFCHEIFRDIESEPGYIIFGWYIDDFVTEEAGNIKFSIRIYSLGDDEEVEYSFSTLSQTLIIKPSMNYSVATTDFVTHDVNWVLSHIKSSSQTGGGNAKDVIITGVKLGNTQEYSYNSSSAANTSYTLDLDSNNSKVLAISAGSEDTGTIGYKWQKASGAGLDASYDYEITDDTSPIDVKRYYADVASGKQLQQNVTSIPVEGDSLYPFYEQYSTQTVSSAGTYYCTITNTYKTKTSNKKVEFIIPSPAAANPSKTYITVNDGYDTTAERYHIIISDTSVGANLVVVATKENDDDTLMYQWTKNGSSYLERTSNNILNVKEISNTADANGDTYQCKVYEARNNEYNLLGETNIYRVTYAPEKPVFAGLNGNNRIKVASPSPIELSFSNTFKSDKVMYQLYKLGDTGTEIDSSSNGETDDVAIGNPSLSNVVTYDSSIMSKGDTVYCIATNYLNGELISSEPSEEIYIN